MPKRKIKKSVSKRFKVTKTGKVLYSHQNAGHLKLNKSKRTLRRGRIEGTLKGTFGKNIKKLLGVK